ncbi:MAG: DUF5702 domain-containing protein [Oscillospiraceae bacterium]|jgi:hypothetical protein|nr:DUF5702 domain-containing protein [Oscillospiraceae bacterium]
MRDLLKNTKGAVTVFVTLLLIPAILISGTAVDLARIHTARSIIQDANQLAANATLTQYNALLYDLYALFAIAEDDPIFEKLLDEYISVSVFGENNQDKSVGTLQLFYGSNITLEDIEFQESKNLRNEDVLRRQIEEYMKLRAPVIIVKDLLELLGSNTFKEDSGVIADKLEIEETIAEIFSLYSKLYDAINTADECNQVGTGIAGYTVGTVSNNLVSIREQFISLEATYRAWENAETSMLKDDYAARYRAILVNIKSQTQGGPVGRNWQNGRWANSGNWQGLSKTIENAIGNADTFKPRFDNVVTIARQIDGKKSELKQKINALESRLDKGGVNDELKSALTEPTGSDNKSIIDRYKDILKWENTGNMAKTYKDNGYDYIDNIVKPYLDSVIYRNRNNTSAASLTRTELANLSGDARFALSESAWVSQSFASQLTSYTQDSITYKMPPGFKKFRECSEEHNMFFEELQQLATQKNTIPVKLFDEQGNKSGNNSEASQRNLIDDLLNLTDTAYNGMTNNPLGAKYINTNISTGTNNKDINNITKVIPEASLNPVSDIISDVSGSIAKAGDYLLLLTYCTSVFSNYTTAKPDSIGKTLDDIHEISFPKSITGIPISPKVNYFFQSEWEYLYNGSESASSNLSTISGLIYIVRLICNYITVFSVSEVTMIVNSIRAAFAWNPPLGLILGELARGAFVAAESAVDVAMLRTGKKVPLIKSGKNGEWICSPSGIAKALANLATDSISDNSPNDKGLSYSNYMMLFFITKALTTSDAGVELVNRTANLIEWNITNYRNNLYSDEEKMTEALAADDMFKMENMRTDFAVTTTVNMRMLFLSMGFAQNFSNSRGIGMPRTMPISVTDYRGY